MPGVLTYPEARRIPSGLLSLVHTVLDLVYPPRCVGCGRVDTGWCHVCQHELDDASCHIETRAVFNLITIASTGKHEGKLQQAVHALKYDGIKDLCVPLGDRLVEALHQLGWVVDVVVPVPLHPTRYAERGYNQAELLAAEIVRQLSLPYQPDAIIRNRATRSQVGLTRNQRYENVMDAFMVDSMFLAGKRILLVDDVATTGATLAACAQALQARGVQAVYGLTVTTAT